MLSFLSRLSWNDHGATAIEYGLIAALIALASLGAIQLFADAAITNWFFISNSVVANS